MHFRKRILIVFNLQYLLFLSWILATARAVEGTLRLY